jgi:hypothetical protein
MPEHTNSSFLNNSLSRCLHPDFSVCQTEDSSEEQQNRGPKKYDPAQVVADGAREDVRASPSAPLRRFPLLTTVVFQMSDDWPDGLATYTRSYKQPHSLCGRRQTDIGKCIGNEVVRGPPKYGGTSGIVFDPNKLGSQLAANLAIHGKALSKTYSVDTCSAGVQS